MVAASVLPMDDLLPPLCTPPRGPSPRVPSPRDPSPRDPSPRGPQSWARGSLVGNALHFKRAHTSLCQAVGPRRVGSGGFRTFHPEPAAASAPSGRGDQGPRPERGCGGSTLLRRVLPPRVPGCHVVTPCRCPTCPRAPVNEGSPSDCKSGNGVQQPRRKPPLRRGHIATGRSLLRGNKTGSHRWGRGELRAARPAGRAVTAAWMAPEPARPPQAWTPRSQAVLGHGHRL